jgi:hypothetical protein
MVDDCRCLIAAIVNCRSLHALLFVSCVLLRQSSTRIPQNQTQQIQNSYTTTATNEMKRRKRQRQRKQDR